MIIDKIMTKALVSVQMDDSLKVIKDIFDNTSFHHLIVVESDKLVGIISDRDLFLALSPNLGLASQTEKDKATLNKKAHQIMSRNPKTLKAKDDVYAAIDLFNTESISCIPIINRHKQPIGILSWRDLIRVIAENQKK